MKKVAIIFTGGTISMKVDKSLKAAIPALTSEEIMAKVTGIEKIAEIELMNFGKYPGPHMTPELMIQVLKKTKEFLNREDIAGIVITHGTDTLEETAYMLDLTLSSIKPVVITGAMRNSSELGYDGPANLAASICTVVSEESKNKGVLVVMNNKVIAASEVMKTHTLDLDTFQSMDFGPLGIVDQDEVIYYRSIRKRQFISTEKLENHVELLKVAVGMRGDLIEFCISSGAKGLIIEAMGRGNLPPMMVEGVRRCLEKNIPVVIVSRCPLGRVLDSYGYPGGGKELKDIGAIFGGNLSGEKARIKLMLILSITKDLKKIKEIFEEGLYTKA